MIKKICNLILLFLVVFQTNLNAVDVNVFFLTGIRSIYHVDNSGNYTANVGKTPLESQVVQLYNKLNGIDNKLIIGHSMGGIKALGYAGYWSRYHENPENSDNGNLSGIITIGAPLKGFLGLAEGRAAFNRKASDLVSKIGRGATSITKPISLIIPEVGFLSSLFDLGTAGLSSAIAKQLFSPIDLAQLPFDLSDQVMTDITPGSRFMRDFIEPEAEVIKQGYYEKRKKAIGSQTVPVYATQTDVFGYKYTIITGWKQETIYEYYKVWIAPKTISIPRLDEDIAVGMILGSNNDPLNLMDNDNDRQSLRVAIGALQTALDASEKANIALSVTYGVLLNIPMSVYHGVAANDAKVAYDLFVNYKKEYGYLIGGSSNDGFIAKSSQSRSIASIGGKSIGDDEGFVFNVEDACHAGNPNIAEYNHRSIWSSDGRGGLYRNNITDQLKSGAIGCNDGQIRKWLNSNDWSIK